MKYPFDIYAAKNKKSTLSIEAHFVRETEESPMKVFQEPFSRYRFNLIEGGKAIFANVPVDEVEGAIQRTKALYYMSTTPTVAEPTGSSSPAYTVRFFAGNLKGKTPVDVLAENGYEKGKEILNKQYAWLKENLAKFPANQKQMNAIKEAAKLTPEDIEKAVSSSPESTGAIVPILTEDVRPLRRNKREDGKCLCYGLSVTYEQGKNYPVSVTIENYYAPVRENENGTLNAVPSQKDPATFNKFSMSLSLDEWMKAVKAIELSRDAFYIANFTKALNLAEEGDKKNRQEAAEAVNSGKVAMMPETPEAPATKAS